MSSAASRAWITDVDNNFAKTTQLVDGAVCTRVGRIEQERIDVVLGATSTKLLDKSFKALVFIDKISLEIRANVDSNMSFQLQVVLIVEPMVCQMHMSFL